MLRCLTLRAFYFLSMIRSPEVTFEDVLQSGHPTVGTARVIRGPRGPVTNVQYKTESDGCISLHESGWQEFLKGKRKLRPDTLVVITIKKSNNNDYQMMVVVDHV